jgi:hypothetical protein
MSLRPLNRRPTRPRSWHSSDCELCNPPSSSAAGRRLRRGNMICCLDLLNSTLPLLSVKRIGGSSAGSRCAHASLGRFTARLLGKNFFLKASSHPFRGRSVLRSFRPGVVLPLSEQQLAQLSRAPSSGYSDWALNCNSLQKSSSRFVECGLCTTIALRLAWPTSLVAVVSSIWATRRSLGTEFASGSERHG